MIKKKRSSISFKPFFKAYWWVALLVLIPVSAITVLTLHYSVHVPFWDQWEFVKILEKQATHTLSFADFWAQHNEHRIFFPRLIWFALAMFTAWDPYYEVIVNVGLALVSVVFAWLILKRTFPNNKGLFILSGILSTWLLLSPIQQENWLWGWQIQWFLSVLAVLITIWCLTAPILTRKLFILAAIGGVVATYSLANGVTIWIVGLAVLFFLGSTKRKKIYWTIIGLVTSGVNYLNYVNPEYEPSKTLFLHQPLEFIQYVLAYIGRPLSFDFIYAPLTGAILLLVFLASCIYLFIYRRKETKSLVAWLAIAVYALMGAVLTAISRLGLGVDQSYSSRYSTIATLFVVATVVLVITGITLYTKKYKLGKSAQKVAIYIVILPVATLMLLNYAIGVYQMKEKNQHLLLVRQCAQTAQSADDDCLLLLYPNKAVVWERLEYLRSKGLGGF